MDQCIGKTGVIQDYSEWNNAWCVRVTISEDRTVRWFFLPESLKLVEDKPEVTPNTPERFVLKGSLVTAVQYTGDVNTTSVPDTIKLLQKQNHAFALVAWNNDTAYHFTVFKGEWIVVGDGLLRVLSDECFKNTYVNL